MGLVPRIKQWLGGITTFDEFAKLLAERQCTTVRVRLTRESVRSGPSSGNTAPFRVEYGAVFHAYGNQCGKLALKVTTGHCRAGRDGEARLCSQEAIEYRAAQVDETISELQRRFPHLDIAP